MAGILFFDIRNFSLHRAFLGAHSKAVRTTDLIRDLLTSASQGAVKTNEACRLTSQPWMNHTGDGFILIFHGDKGSLAALAFASIFRRTATDRIKRYNHNLKELLDAHRVPDLGWGIGIDDGGAFPFEYQGINGTICDGYIGSALNKASRVEAATKDHPYQVICTGTCYERLQDQFTDTKRNCLKKFFAPLGLHTLRGFKKHVSLFGCESDLHQQSHFLQLFSGRFSSTS
jgi:class 3 adenylate cyclase